MPFQTHSTYPKTQKPVNHLTEPLNLTLDAVAPLKKRLPQNILSWYTENTRALKQASRKMERKNDLLELLPVTQIKMYLSHVPNTLQ
jgi:hypothetical protein